MSIRPVDMSHVTSQKQYKGTFALQVYFFYYGIESEQEN